MLNSKNLKKTLAAISVVSVLFPSLSSAAFPVSVVLGQSTASSNSTGIEYAGLNQPHDVSVDEQGRVAVADTGNNRVLIWNSVPSSFAEPADVIIGQFSGDQITAETAEVDGGDLNAPQGVFIGEGRLMVADTGNNRVLIWNSIPTLTGTPADVVIGQNTMTTTNYSPIMGMNEPRDVYYRDGRLYVADYNNRRVLMWNGLPTMNGERPYTLAGRYGFFNVAGYPNQLNHIYPTAVMEDAQGNFLVVDEFNNRVLAIANSAQSLFAPEHYSDEIDAISIGTLTSEFQDINDLLSQNQAIGQLLGGVVAPSSPAGVFFSPSRDRLFISNTDANQVKVWENGDFELEAREVIGANDQLGFGATANSLRGPRGLAETPDGRLLVADTLNNRVNIYEFPVVSIGNATVTEGTNTTQVLGQETPVTTITFPITLAEPATVEHRLFASFILTDGTATVGTDVFFLTTTTDSNPTPVVSEIREVVIPVGASSAEFSVAVNRDALVEADETFTLTFANTSTGAYVLFDNRTVVGTIVNDDSATTGDGGGQLDGVPPSGGGNDQQNPPTDTGSSNNNNSSGNGGLGGTTGGNGNLPTDAENNDSFVFVSAASSAASFAENVPGGSRASANIMLSRPASADVTVEYFTRSRTAVDGEDFLGFSEGELRTAVIEAGQTQVQAGLYLVNDDTPEVQEYFDIVVRLPETGNFVPNLYLIGGQSELVVPIYIDSEEVLPLISIGSGQTGMIFEGAPAEIFISLSAPSTVPFSVGILATSGSLDSDEYSLSANSVYFPAGTLTQGLVFTANSDSVVESVETVTFVPVISADTAYRVSPISGEVTFSISDVFVGQQETQNNNNNNNENSSGGGETVPQADIATTRVGRGIALIPSAPVEPVASSIVAPAPSAPESIQETSGSVDNANVSVSVGEPTVSPVAPVVPRPTPRPSATVPGGAAARALPVEAPESGSASSRIATTTDGTLTAPTSDTPTGSSGSADREVEEIISQVVGNLGGRNPSFALDSESGTLSASYVRRTRLFGVLPVSYEESVIIRRTDEEPLAVSRPWWTALTSGDSLRNTMKTWQARAAALRRAVSLGN